MCRDDGTGIVALARIAAATPRSSSNARADVQIMASDELVSPGKAS